MKSYGITSVGLVRSKNQDYFFATDEKIGKLNNLYIVADGMGGHRAGEVASAKTVDFMVDYIKNNDGESVKDLLFSAAQSANYEVYKESVIVDEYRGMGTTLVAATIDDGSIHIINVGDSRLYVYKDKLEQLTLDHSRVEELFRAGLISEKERMDFPNKNIITRAVGIDPKVDIDYFKVDLEDTKYILICSDGLTKMLEDSRVEEYFYDIKDLEASCKSLVDEVNEKGGIDNTTIIIVDINGEN